MRRRYCIQRRTGDKEPVARLITFVCDCFSAFFYFVSYPEKERNPILFRPNICFVFQPLACAGGCVEKKEKTGSAQNTSKIKKPPPAASDTVKGLSHAKDRHLWHRGSMLPRFQLSSKQVGQGSAWESTDRPETKSFTQYTIGNCCHRSSAAGTDHLEKKLLGHSLSTHNTA